MVGIAVYIYNSRYLTIIEINWVVFGICFLVLLEGEVCMGDGFVW